MLKSKSSSRAETIAGELANTLTFTSSLITQLALFDPDKLRRCIQGMLALEFVQSWKEICASSDLHLSLGGPMHQRVLYQPVNVGPYSEDSLSVLCSGCRLYLWYNGERRNFPDPRTDLYMLLKVSPAVQDLGLSFGHKGYASSSPRLL